MTDTKSGKAGKPPVKSKGPTKRLPKVSAKGKHVALPDEDWAEEVKETLDGLNDRQTVFVMEYVKDLDRVRSYRAAYGIGMSYMTAAVQAHHLLKNPKIRVAVRMVGDATIRQYKCDPAFVVAEMSKIANSNMGDYINIKDDGSIVTDLSMMTRDQSGAIQELQVEETFEPDELDGTPGRRGQKVKIKLTDRRQALNDLAKYLKMFSDNFSPQAETKSILADVLEEKLTIREAAYRINMLGLPLPEVLKIELGKLGEEPPTPAPSISDEEGQAKYEAAMANRAEQLERFVPFRREEVQALKMSLAGAASFDPPKGESEQ